MGSGFNSIPGPPLNGVSSTVRRASEAKSRGSVAEKLHAPFSDARLVMLCAKAPNTISGNSVTKSNRNTPTLYVARPFDSQNRL